MLPWSSRLVVSKLKMARRKHARAQHRPRSGIGASAGTVSIVRKLLIERDWAIDTPDGILFTQPEKLLRDWAQVWGRRAFRPFAYSSRLGTQETEKQLADFKKTQDRYLAFTGAAAAWRYAR